MKELKTSEVEVGVGEGLVTNSMMKELKVKKVNYGMMVHYII